MIGYVMLGSNDLDRARTFYDPLLAHLGMAANGYTSESRVWYSAGPSPPMLVITKTWDGAPASVGNGSMLALGAPTRALVDQIHAQALALGGADEGAPGIRGDDPDGFYGAYFRDLDGNKLCVFRAGPA
ncbi:VOC family protein [Phenylobacterium aquaticum]|uniref:VOC family protein n=1 Tax=Phenylobacterium aquaticum TaxID=1763816 RepID=UPI001F5C8708|nr:VOC family protein [Phenylobacterium aquaticum]MCI3135420.1 VOC family protein [Phenylobacterium aquaticum]